MPLIPMGFNIALFALLVESNPETIDTISAGYLLCWPGAALPVSTVLPIHYVSVGGRQFL
jgi:hypothetical protein